MESVDKSKILKNTLTLYARMILAMFISLYTSRIVLEQLGVVDFGVYNVVGGIVTMFAFLNSAMSSATQRFLSYEIGRKNIGTLKKVFSVSVTIHIFISVIVFILAETIGLWFLNVEMTIPSERMYAANWVYQCSILSCVIGILSVPYNALIIAKEKMAVFAYVAVLEVFLKLICVLLLLFFNNDRLITYSVFMMITALIVRIIYQMYCRLFFPESQYSFIYDKELFASILSFSGWSLFGGIAYSAKNQGINLILNIFCGPIANAAWSIAQQVFAALFSMISNFALAINPAIVKAYANNDKSNTLMLLFGGMKYSFFLSLCIILPVYFNCDFLLKIWLKNIPEGAVMYTQFLLFILLIESIIYPISATVQATGRIKWYQIIVGGILFFNLPLSYFALKLGGNIIVIFYIAVIISIVCILARLLILYRLIDLPFINLIKLLYLVSGMLIFNICMYLYMPVKSSTFFSTIITSILILILNSLIFYFIGLERVEKDSVRRRIQFVYHSIFKFL